jgi:hypothetical protein
VTSSPNASPGFCGRGPPGGEAAAGGGEAVAGGGGTAAGGGAGGAGAGGVVAAGGVWANAARAPSDPPAISSSAVRRAIDIELSHLNHPSRPPVTTPIHITPAVSWLADLRSSPCDRRLAQRQAFAI